MYVVGGRESSICHRTVEVYCPHTNRWTMKAPMNKRRGSVSIVAYNKALFVFGGHDLPVSSKLLTQIVHSGFRCRYSKKKHLDSQKISHSFIFKQIPHAQEQLLWNGTTLFMILGQ